MEYFQSIAAAVLSALMIASPILIAAAGGLISQRSGIVNIALEGLMTIGAMTAATSHFILETKTGFSIPAALLLATVSGGVFSIFHAFACVTLKTDEIISGTGINLLSGATALFACQLIFRMDRSRNYIMGMKQGLFGISPAIIIALVIAAAVWFFLYKRPRALRPRAADVNPEPSAQTRVNVNKTRYTAILLSGLLAGLAGALIVLTQYNQFTVNAVSGKGFIALAAVYFAHRSAGIFAFCFLIGVFFSLAANITGITGTQFISQDMLNMLPFLITLLTLIVFGRKSRKASDKVITKA